jgi:HlyD family secretion protein
MDTCPRGIAVLILCLICLAPPAQAAGIAGFGRIQPAGGTVSVSAAGDDTIAAIRVREGQQVAAGDILAVLGSRATRELQLEEAKLALAQAELERASGLRIEERKHSDIADNLEWARGRLSTLKDMDAASYASPEYMEEREQNVVELEQQLEVSKLALEKVRGAADLAVTRAQKQVAIAEAALAESTVRAPLAGTVLKVLGRAGERVGPVLFMMGDTTTMYVLAEIYESDALRLKPGQKAGISSAALPVKLTGVVESAGGMIFRSTLQSLDAAAQTGSRVLEALIRLDPNPYAAKLINLQVDVVIQE